MKPPKRGNPHWRDGGSGYSAKASGLPGDHSTARHCAHCQIPMPAAPAWHRLCPVCYRMARVETYIGKALRLLREIQVRDGVRR